MSVSSGGLPPNPMHRVEFGDDPVYGRGVSTYSADGKFRYQTTRQFHGGEWKDDAARTLAVIGLSPDPDSDAGRLDWWARPYADAAREAGYGQLVVVCAYGTMADRPALQHADHGLLNGYFAEAAYLAEHARTVAVALPPAYRPCPDCLDRVGPVTRLRGLESLGEDVEVVRLATFGEASGGALWMPVGPPVAAPGLVPVLEEEPQGRALRAV